MSWSARTTAVLLLILFASSGCRKEKKLTANLNVENKVAVRSVQLFYESSEMTLIAERRDVPLPENPGGAIPVILRELLKGSANESIPRLFPDDTVLRAAYLLPEGTVLVDLSGPTLTEGWSTGSHQELMAVHSVVQTMTTNFSEARRVRFLLNGQPAETLGGHVALSRPVGPVPGAVAAR